MDGPHSGVGGLSRRDLLKGAAGAGLTACLASAAACSGRPSASRRTDLIRAENDRPGTSDWLLRRWRVDPKTLRSPAIEGYCSRTSARPGERLAFMVSTDPPSPFVIDLYRLGYYGGKGGRHLSRLGPFRGEAQPEPGIGPERLRECRWEPATTITLPPDWTSGVYLGKLTAEKGGLESYVVFVVRDDRACDFLFQCSDSTWSAYNPWPGSWSLYCHDTRNPRLGGGWWVGGGVKVSWDRPYSQYCQVYRAPQTVGSGSFLLTEFPLAFWMEKEGYDVSYIGNVDTHADARGLLRAKAWLSVGHDEYWSIEMFRNVQAAVAAGVNAAFLSSDTCWGVIPFLPSGEGAPHRVITRVGHFGPLDERSAREHWPELRDFKQNGPDEGMLIGARNIYPYNGGGDWICANEKHWIFDGTGMRNGDRVTGLVGWEWMGKPAEISGLEVVARGPIFSGGRNRGVEYTATIYPGPKGNFVFNGGTIWWGDGLSAPPGHVKPDSHGITPPEPDARVQRVTANLFDRFRA